MVFAYESTKDQQLYACILFQEAKRSKGEGE